MKNYEAKITIPLLAENKMDAEEQIDYILETITNLDMSCCYIIQEENIK